MKRYPRFAAISCLLSVTFLLLSCQTTRQDAGGDNGVPRRSVVDRGEFDEAAGPGRDFFQYINGKWFKAHPIPADQASWGVDYVLLDRVQNDLKAIAEELQADPAAAGNRQKVRDFYATAMDEAAIQKDGINSLRPELDRIAAVNTREDLIRVVASMHLAGAGPLFGSNVSQDEKKSDAYALHLTQGGTLLPERSYYTDDDEHSTRIRREYVAHMSRMFRLLGDDDAAASAQARTVLGIETRLAQAQMSSVELRDVEKQYNRMNRAEFAKLVPSFNWDIYFQLLSIADVKEMIVAQPAFMKRIEELLGQVSMEDWRTYLRWHLLCAAAPCLSDPFVDENFGFFGRLLGGAEKLKPRWKRAIAAINSNIGEALGRLYVERHFSPEAKRRVSLLVDNLLAAYAQRIRTRDWMSPATKEKALVKLNAIGRKLGYPDKWRDYSSLAIARDSYLRNTLRAREFESRRQLARLGGPVDRGKWGMTPPTINAYYDPAMNEICFPAAILQAPYFDAVADDALNYGGIGSIIGHELTHGFDDQGCKFDAAGNMVNWWTDQDKARFDERTRRLVQQFNGCVAVDDMHINGELTLGENIADLGGLAIAYDAYKRATAGQAVPAIDGLTGDQRFFISYAICWRDIDRDELVKNRLRTDEHAPPHFRVLVPLSNFQPFYDAFGVKQGDAMYRPATDRAEVW
ncbi:MAG: M13 family metallopeptidase [Tepidisphaerales bacterium]